MSPEQLKTAILEKYASVHAFCRAHKADIARSSVYQVLSGHYPGDIPKQLRRIEKILNGEVGNRELEQIHAVIKSVACSRCRKKGRGSCRRCRATMREQAIRINDLLKGGADVCD